MGRDTLYWHYPLEKPHFLGERSSGALRQGAWKLIEYFDTGAIEIYNLSQDPGEQRNLALKHPRQAAALAKQLTVWHAHIGVHVPPACQRYDPAMRGKARGEK